MLTDLQKRKITRFFTVYDIDKNGVITQEDPEQIAQNLMEIRDMKAGSNEYNAFYSGFMYYWNDFIKAADANKDGQLSLDEWLAYHDTLLQNKEQFEQTVLMATGVMFDVMDLNGDGKISLEEYGRWMEAFRMGEESKTEKVFQRLDINGDGSLSKEEILELTRQFYYSNDPESPGNWCMGPF